MLVLSRQRDQSIMIGDDIQITVVDVRGDKVGAKIRQATIERVPYMLVVGGREAESGRVAVRERDGRDHGPMDLDAFLTLAKERIATRK